jgi:hypothetical protein
VLVGGWCDPSADVDVVVEELGGQLCAPAERVEVAAAEVVPVRVVDGVGEGVAFSELALVPDEVDEVVLFVDGPGGPAAASRLLDQRDARVDPRTSSCRCSREIAAATRS